MKKTVRSLLAVVMAVSMLLSMVIVSGLSVSAENEQRYYITADQITNSEGANSAAASGSYLTPSEDGKGWTMESIAISSGGVFGSFVISDADIVKDLPYLVFDVDESSTVAQYTITGWNDSIVDIYPSNPGAAVWYDGTFLNPKKDITCNLYELVGEGSGATFQIRLDTAIGGKLVVNSIYLTNVNPNPEVAAEDDFVRISDMTPGMAGPDTNVTAYGKYGASFAYGANNYAYYEIPRATVDANPYFYYQMASLPTGNLGWYSICGPGWTANPQHLTASTELQVLDLRTTAAYAAGGSVLFQVWVGSQLDMAAAFLASTPDVTLAPATKFVNVVDAYFDGLTDATLTVQNNVGVHVQGSYTYFAFSKDVVDNTPYLVFKFDQTRYLSVAGTYGPGWWANPQTFELIDNLYIDDQVHVVNLQETPAYAAGGTVLLMLAYGEPVEFDFDCLVLTNNPDFDYTEFMGGEEEEETVYYEVNFVTNGGSAVYSQVVPANGIVDAVVTEKDGYVFKGWETADGEAFDLATPVTEDITLYAVWGFAAATSPVFAQLETGVDAESESASIRFVAAIDTLNMYEVGFVASISNANPEIGGENVTRIRTTTVWTSINAGDGKVAASDLGGDYIYGLTITGIDNANFDTDIYVRAYARTADGEYVYTDVKTYSVASLF